MTKPKEFKVTSIEDFQSLVNDKDFRIAQALVESIIRNIKTRKKRVHVLSVKCAEENATFDITLEKEFFVDTLKDNIKYYEDRQMFEDCVKISKAISTLSKD